MTNKYFPDEEIQTNDLYFICYMIVLPEEFIREINMW